MRIHLLVFLVGIVSWRAAHAKDWKSTFPSTVVETYLAGEDLAVAVVAAGTSFKEAQAAAKELSGAVGAADPFGDIVNVPRAKALAKLDDAAIVAKLARKKVDLVFVVRVDGNGIEVKIYDGRGNTQGSFVAVAGKAITPKAEQKVVAGKALTPKAEQKVVAGEALTPTAEQKPFAAVPLPVEVEPQETDPGDETVTETVDAPPQPKPYDRSGPYVDMRLGLHSTSQAVGGGGPSVDVGETVAIEIHGAYRLGPWVSGGLTYFNSMYSPEEPASVSFHGFLLQGRGYLSFGAIDVFAEAGLGWCWFGTGVEAGAFSSKATAKGVSLEAGLGAMYYLLDYLGAGLYARINLPAFTSLCVQTGDSPEICGTPSSNMKDISYGLTVAFNPFGLEQLRQ